MQALIELVPIELVPIRERNSSETPIHARRHRGHPLLLQDPSRCMRIHCYIRLILQNQHVSVPLFSS